MQIDQNITKKSFPISTVLDYFKNTSIRPSPELQDRRERCIPIIQKLPNNRTKEEENLLISVLKQYNFLENASQDEGKEDKVLSKLSKTLEYEVIPAGTAICHKGELGNKFYLIIKGRAIAYTEIPQEPQEPQETSIKSFRLLNSSQINNQDSDSFSRKSFLLQDDSQKSIKKGRPNIFQQKIIKRDLNKLVNQGNLRFAGKKFTRENHPQTTWDVDRVLSFMDASYKPKLLNMNNDNAKETDEKYLEMLFEYKLLEFISSEMPGKYIKDGHFLYKATKKLREGDFFGEHALISNKPRNATVIASQDLHCLTISKKDYQCVSARKAESINPNIKFLQGFFPDSAKMTIVKLAHLFEEYHYSYNQVIFEEEAQPDGIYFIKEGKVQLVKRMLSRGDQLPSSLERKQSKKNIVTVFGEGEIVGEEEVFAQKNRESSAIVSSKEARLFRFDKKAYDGLNDMFKGIFSGLTKFNKTKRDSKSQPRTEARGLVESIKSKKLNLNFSECQESPGATSYDLFSRFSGLVEMSSAKVARQNVLDDQSLHHHKQASMNGNPPVVNPVKKAPVSTAATEKIVGNSKKFFKKIFYQDESQKNKSQIEPPDTSLSKTACPFEAESKPYVLRLDTDIGAPTPELNSSRALSEANDYMLIKSQNLIKNPNKSLQKKQGTLRKIIEFRLNLQPPSQPNSRKDTRGTTVTQTNASINLSQEESSGQVQKEGENNSFQNLKKSWRPPTSGGYYSVYRDMIVGQRAPLNQVSPTANITLLSRVHAMRTTRERTPICESAGIATARVNTSQVDKRKSNLLKPRPSPREDVQEESNSNSKIGKTFSEYFRGLAESGEVSGKRTTASTTRVQTAVSNSVMKMRTTGDYFKKRENLGNKGSSAVEKLLTLQTLMIKPTS